MATQENGEDNKIQSEVIVIDEEPQQPLLEEQRDQEIEQQPDEQVVETQPEIQGNEEQQQQQLSEEQEQPQEEHPPNQEPSEVVSTEIPSTETETMETEGQDTASQETDQETKESKEDDNENEPFPFGVGNLIRQIAGQKHKQEVTPQQSVTTATTTSTTPTLSSPIPSMTLILPPPPAKPVGKLFPSNQKKLPRLKYHPKFTYLCQMIKVRWNNKRRQLWNFQSLYKIVKNVLIIFKNLMILHNDSWLLQSTWATSIRTTNSLTF